MVDTWGQVEGGGFALVILAIIDSFQGRGCSDYFLQRRYARTFCLFLVFVLLKNSKIFNRIVNIYID